MWKSVYKHVERIDLEQLANETKGIGEYNSDKSSGELLHVSAASTSLSTCKVFLYLTNNAEPGPDLIDAIEVRGPHNHHLVGRY